MNQLQAFSSSPVKASSIMGKDVVNPQGESLGDIKEVVIGPRTGKVAYVVVSFGGFSVWEKSSLPSVQRLHIQRDNERIQSRCQQGTPEGGPWIRRGHWPSMSEEKWNRDVYQYYERQPYWE
jgi:sporulation protein YlmC with PRC-barrel domain